MYMQLTNNWFNNERIVIHKLLDCNDVVVAQVDQGLGVFVLTVAGIRFSFPVFV